MYILYILYILLFSLLLAGNFAVLSVREWILVGIKLWLTKNYIHICLFRLYCSQRAFNIIISRMCDVSTRSTCPWCVQPIEGVDISVCGFQNLRHERSCITAVPFRVARNRVSRADLFRFFPLYSRKRSFIKAPSRIWAGNFKGWNFMNVKIAGEKEQEEWGRAWKNFWIAIVEGDIVWRLRYFSDRIFLFCIGNIEIKISSEPKVFFTINSNLSFNISAIDRDSKKAHFHEFICYGKMA